MYKFLHIAPDEKFIDSANFIFDKAFPNINNFIIYIPNKGYSLNFIKNTNNIETLVENSISIKLILSKLDDYDLVFLHSMSYFNSRILINYKNKEKFVLMFWGWEIYNNHYSKIEDIHGNETKGIIKNNHKFKDSLLRKVRSLYFPIKNSTPNPEKSILLAFKKIKYIATVYKEEIEYLKKNNFISKHTKLIKFTYYPLEFIFRGLEKTKINNSNILVGNSALSSNNHLEIFKLLKLKDLSDKKIITPLNYGNSKYANIIIDTGKREFGNSFHPLTDFLPLGEYNKIISSCSVAIFNNYRQQAIGSTIAMIWLGAKVYLNDKNSVYHYLKRLGIKVFSIKSDFKIGEDFSLEKLCEKDINYNKRILLEEFNESRVIASLKRQISDILNEYK